MLPFSLKWDKILATLKYNDVELSTTVTQTFLQWGIKQHIPRLNKAHRQAQKTINTFEPRIKKYGK